MSSVDASITHCPKCQAKQSDGTNECDRCGIIFAKYRPFAMRASGSSSTGSFTGSKLFLAAKQWLVESDAATGLFTLVGRAVVFLLLV
jgi:hypothetical protein